MIKRTNRCSQPIVELVNKVMKCRKNLLLFENFDGFPYNRYTPLPVEFRGWTCSGLVCRLPASRQSLGGFVHFSWSLSAWRLSPGWYLSSLYQTFQNTPATARTDWSLFYIFRWEWGIHWMKHSGWFGQLIFL